MPIDLRVFGFAIIKFLKLMSLNHLTEVLEALDACTSWIVSKICSESVILKGLGIRGANEVYKEFTNTCEIPTNVLEW